MKRWDGEIFMKKILQSFLVIAFTVTLTMFLPTLMQAQSALSGKVIDEEGKPLEGAIISFDRVNVEHHVEVKSDETGRYFMGGLKPAFYKIELIVDGETKARFAEFRIKLGNENVLDFDLAEIRRLAYAQLSDEEREAIEKERLLREAEEKKYTDMKSTFEEGQTLFKAQQYQQAAVIFQKASEIDPSRHAIFGVLGESYQRLKKFDQALESYDKALALLANEPESDSVAQYHLNIGIIRAQSGQLKPAKESMEKAAKINPVATSRAFYNLGVVLTNGGLIEEAIKAFKRAIKLDSKNSKAYYQLGISLVGMATFTSDGKTIPAPGTIEALETYLKLDPNGPNAAQAKSMISTLSGNIATDFNAK